jgi:hypothetical protein
MYKPRDYSRYPAEGKVVITGETEPSFSLNGDLLEISSQGFAMIGNSSVEPGKTVRFEITSSVTAAAFSGKAIVRGVREINQKSGITYRIGAQFVEVNKDLIVSLLDRLTSNTSRKIRGTCYNLDELKGRSS